MRYTLAQAAKERQWEALRGWWVDWPVRRKAFWAQLLFYSGEGWLRWKVVRDTKIVGYDVPEPEDYMWAPPLRRVAWYLKGWVQAPWLLLFGSKASEGERFRYSWRDVRPTWADLNYDDWGRNPNRRYELMQYGWRGWKR